MIRSTKFNRSLAGLSSVLFAGLLMVISTAHSTSSGSSSSGIGEAADYAQTLAGKWRGGGIVIREKNGKQIKLRCSAKNTLDTELRTLRMKGRCASTIGSRPLLGVFTYSEDGNEFEEVSLKIAGRGGVSTALLEDKQLTLDAGTTLKSGEFSVNRNVISWSQDEYSIDLYSEEEGEYISRGTLNFNRKGS